MYALAWHWGSAEQALGHGSAGPPSELHPVLCGPLGEVLNRPVRNSRQAQNVDHICQGRANLKPGKVYWNIKNFSVFPQDMGRFELYFHKETCIHLLGLWWPQSPHRTCFAADCPPCWASGRWCNAASLLRSIWHTCYPADRRSWIQRCSWRHARGHRIGWRQQHQCWSRPQQTWGWGISSCLGFTKAALTTIINIPKCKKK